MADDDYVPPFYSENIIAEGNLTSDPKDISRNKNGSVVVARIACNYRDYDGEEGTFYRNIKVTNHNAPNFYASAKKGNRVVVVGRIVGNTYETRDGDEVQSENILVDFIGASYRFNEVNVVRGSRSRRRDDDDYDDDYEDSYDDEDEEEEERPRRRPRRSSGGRPRRSSSRRSRVTSRGDDDDDDEFMDE